MADPQPGHISWGIRGIHPWLLRKFIVKCPALGMLNVTFGLLELISSSWMGNRETEKRQIKKPSSVKINRYVSPHVTWIVMFNHWKLHFPSTAQLTSAALWRPRLLRRQGSCRICRFRLGLAAALHSNRNLEENRRFGWFIDVYLFFRRHDYHDFKKSQHYSFDKMSQTCKHLQKIARKQTESLESPLRRENGWPKIATIFTNMAIKLDSQE